MAVNRPAADATSPRIAAWVTVLAAIALIGAIWMMVLLKLGISDATRRPAAGVLSNTFNGWDEHPEARRYFLAQYSADEFGQRRSYTTYTYPFLISMYLLVEPFHQALDLSYEVAHNFIVYIQVICLSLLLVFATREQLLAIFQGRSLFHWMLAFLAIGIVVSDPLPWVSLLRFNRDSFHVLAAASFCYLSIWVFRDCVPKTPLLAVGLFLALWSPIYLPAWILAGIFFNRALVLRRRWIVEVLAVSALGGLNLALPALASRWAGFTPVGSGFLYRSGLDGSTQYLTSIYQAVFAPVDPRHWPIGFYLLATAALGVGCHFVFRSTTAHRPLQQALFLTIPYATMAIGLPQFTSIHPYFTDLLIFIPATFLIAFWFLQKECWQNLTGRTYVPWLLAASLILMTNLLTIAQGLNVLSSASQTVP
jgi:hypothetical protein